MLAALWLGLAHLSLLGALGIVARWPALLAGSAWSPPLLAAVHLLTVGCITGTILGALPLVAAMALRTRVPRGRLDLAAWALFAAALLALVAGFWSGRYALVAGAGAVVIVVATTVVARVAWALRGAPVPAGVRRHVPLALAGLVLALGAGVLVAVDRQRPFLPGGFLAGAFAHAHLAVLGWVLPIVFGAAYRLLPMLLPSAMPEGIAVAWSGPLSLLGGVVIAAALLGGGAPLAWAGAALALGGIACFVGGVATMLRHPRPRPPARPRLDTPLLHAAGAVLALVAAAGCGALLVARGVEAPAALRATYGVLALVGCFAQLIVGVGQRLVGWLVWLVAYTRSGFAEVPPTPYALLSRPLQLAVVVLWLGGVPLLAGGAAAASPGLVRAGAGSLLAGTVLDVVLLAAPFRRVLAPRAGRADGAPAAM